MFEFDCEWDAGRNEEAIRILLEKFWKEVARQIREQCDLSAAEAALIVASGDSTVAIVEIATVLKEKMEASARDFILEGFLDLN